MRKDSVQTVLKHCLNAVRLYQVRHPYLGCFGVVKVPLWLEKDGFITETFDFLSFCSNFVAEY